MNRNEDCGCFGGPITVFYSYSHKDEELRNELDKHLSVLKRQGIIAGWHDRAIEAGKDWDDEITRQLKTARIILLLISADFLASEYCWGTEMAVAMDRCNRGEAEVIPVLLRSVYREGAEFARLQALPKDARPVKLWADRDEAFEDIARGISKAAEQLQRKLANYHTNMVCIPAGPFTMGTTESEIDGLVEWAKGIYPGQSPTREWFMVETPRHKVEVDEFFMDTHPVTNGQYKRFTEATGHPEPTGFEELEDTWNYGFKPRDHEDFLGDDQPVVCVSWYDALAYAKWVGCRLPTEAEWEKAARGGLENRRYPWGDVSPDENRCNYGDKSPESLDHPTLCGKYPPNGYSLFDMAGNVWEWCSDVFDENYYRSGQRPTTNPCNGDIPNFSGFRDVRQFLLTLKKQRVIRGGSWKGEEGALRVARRSSFPAAGANNSIGFRCVRDGE